MFFDIYNELCQISGETPYGLGPKIGISKGTISNWQNGGIPRKDIQPSEIQAFINSIAKQGYKRTTVQRPLDVLRMIFDYGVVNTQAIKENPTRAVKLAQGLKQRHRELADAKDIEIIKASTHKSFGLFPFLLLYTGCRRGEALALTQEDIDFDWVS